jgi:hypothetical protein
LDLNLEPLAVSDLTIAVPPGTTAAATAGALIQNFVSLMGSNWQIVTDPVQLALGNVVQYIGTTATYIMTQAIFLSDDVNAQGQFAFVIVDSANNYIGPTAFMGQNAQNNGAVVNNNVYVAGGLLTMPKDGYVQINATNAGDTVNAFMSMVRKRPSA